MMDKKSTLRVAIREQLLNFSGEVDQAKSLQICHHLEQSDFFKTANPVLTFAALPGEPDLMPLFNIRSSQQPFCFPRVLGSQLEARHVSDTNDLVPGYADIREPSPDKCPLFPIQDLRIILLPGLAFDPSNGARLGKGKGFYDRLVDGLRKTPNPSLITIGICFDWQLTQVPAEPHDQSVDAIVTENGLLTSENLLSPNRQ